jgi:glycine/D-amino acid oxidase-like deaminating enzyme
MVTYAQRTVDGRIAFGGRGAPYHFGSQIADRFDRHEGIHRKLEETVREVFPQVADAKITHRWGGPVGAPRDWHAFANVDHSTGLCAGGGYVGDGVALANLVGRTLAHQIADTGDPLTRSLLVGHTSKKWEVEPMRWLGVNGLLALTDFADRRERRTHQPSKRVLAVRDRLLG